MNLVAFPLAALAAVRTLAAAVPAHPCVLGKQVEGGVRSDHHLMPSRVRQRSLLPESIKQWLWAWFQGKGRKLCQPLQGALLF